MRRPVSTELPTPLRREPVAQIVRAGDERGSDISLHVKILAGYVVLGAALVGVFRGAEAYDVPWMVRIGIAAVVTIALALMLPSLLARVTRVKVLSRSALEISRGDLSKPVAT